MTLVRHIQSNCSNENIGNTGLCFIVWNSSKLFVFSPQHNPKIKRTLFIRQANPENIATSTNWYLRLSSGYISQYEFALSSPNMK